MSKVTVLVNFIQQGRTDNFRSDGPDYDYFFEQQSFSSKAPWLPQPVLIRSKQRLDFDPTKQYKITLDEAEGVDDEES